MKQILLQFWYLWALILLFAVLLRFAPQIVGWLGERRVRRILSSLPQEEYTVLNDLMLRTANGTTQIDHVVVSPYGVFVIETKNYKGWIFGNVRSDRWTQSVYGNKIHFHNPIRQNYGHIHAIRKCLDAYPDLKPVSIIAFSDQCELKSVPQESNVVYFSQIPQTILQYRESKLSHEEVADIVERLTRENVVDRAVRGSHAKRIQDKVQAQASAAKENLCPRCGAPLVERKGKHGSFMGCSNYPRCRYTQKH